MATALVATTLLGRGDYFTVVHPSGNMEPTVRIGQSIVFDKSLSPAHGDVGNVRVVDGDVEFDSVVRVVAVGGDPIGCPAGPNGPCDALVLSGTPAAEPHLGEILTMVDPPTGAGSPR